MNAVMKITKEHIYLNINVRKGCQAQEQRGTFSTQKQDLS